VLLCLNTHSWLLKGHASLKIRRLVKRMSALVKVLSLLSTEGDLVMQALVWLHTVWFIEIWFGVA
jgi:hypothetical protein